MASLVGSGVTRADGPSHGVFLWRCVRACLLRRVRRRARGRSNRGRMDMNAMPQIESGNLDAVRLEIQKVKETAERMANGDYPEEADQLRSVAGLVHLLAEQTERLIEPMRAPLSSVDDRHDAEVALEEDRSPERGPAAPLDDRAR